MNHKNGVHYYKIFFGLFKKEERSGSAVVEFSIVRN